MTFHFNNEDFLDVEYKFLTKDWILKNINQETIFNYYFGETIILGKAYKSKLRKDNSPSFSFKYNSRGILIGKDHKPGEFVGDCFEYVKTIYGCSFKQALVHIYKDLCENKSNFNKYKYSIPEEQKLRSVSSNIEYKIKSTNFNLKDLEYWNQFNISEEILKKFYVYSVDKIYKNNELFLTKRKNKLLFAYYIPYTKKFKFYQPESKIFKWFGNVSYEDVFGSHLISKFDKNKPLIITSSLKDVMTLYSLDYQSVAPQNEGTLIPSNYLEYFKANFPFIYILFDNDKAGNIGASKYREVLNLSESRCIFMEIEKDPSDYMKTFKKDKTKEFLNKLICPNLE